MVFIEFMHSPVPSRSYPLAVQAIFHTPVREVESEKQQMFGVAGMHYRFDAFVKAFRQATTLRDLLKFGAGVAIFWVFPAVYQRAPVFLCISATISLPCRSVLRLVPACSDHIEATNLRMR